MRELLLVLALAVSADGPEVGRVPSVTEVAARDITVLPDGRGLPLGSGSARQGAGVYAARCASCHGPRGEGLGDNPALVGGIGSLVGREPVLTVGSYWPYATTVWDYVHRAMPYDQPGSLPADDVYAVTAFVLFLNGIVAETKVLDRATLPLVQMPNRDGFVDDPRPDVASDQSK
jgi:hypothetical protein